MRRRRARNSGVGVDLADAHAGSGWLVAGAQARDQRVEPGALRDGLRGERRREREGTMSAKTLFDMRDLHASWGWRV